MGPEQTRTKYKIIKTKISDNVKICHNVDSLSLLIEKIKQTLSISKQGWCVWNACTQCIIEIRSVIYLYIQQI